MRILIVCCGNRNLQVPLDPKCASPDAIAMRLLIQLVVQHDYAVFETAISKISNTHKRAPAATMQLLLWVFAQAINVQPTVAYYCSPYQHSYRTGY